jgi:hypothetical protein
MAAAVFLAACSSGSDDTASSEATVTATGETAAPEPTEPPTTEPPATGSAPTDGSAASGGDGAADAVPAPAALQFRAPLVGGGEIDLAAGFTGRPTVLWFWAPT